MTTPSDTQSMRWLGLAQDALLHYGLAGAALTLLSTTNNAVYRVDAGASSYVLRLHRPDFRPLGWITSELAWLHAIRTKTHLSVPNPAGSIYTGRLDGQDSPTYCVLFDWIEGEQLSASALTDARVWAVGVFLGELHRFSAGYTPPAGFERPRRDWAGLLGGASDYAIDPAEGAFLTEAQRVTLREAGEITRRVMDSLDAVPGSFGLIHADLIAKNVLFAGEGVAAIDFDDCGWGYFLYDLAPMLWMSRNEPGYDDLRKALWEGYLSVHPDQSSFEPSLDALIAARHVASCRWVIGNRHNPAIHDQAHAMIALRLKELQTFLQTGRLGA